MFLYKPKRPVLAFLFPYYLFFYKPNTISVVCEYHLSGIVCASACPYLCTVIINKRRNDYDSKENETNVLMPVSV